MKIIVCGSHIYSQPNFIRQWLDWYHRKDRIKTLIEGGALHVDAIAGAWAVEHAIEHLKIDAKWHLFGPHAGPIRNAEMLLLEPHVVIAFPGGNGTANMVKQAREAGVPVIEVKYPKMKSMP
jgi:hypothetical protein